MTDYEVGYKKPPRHSQFKAGNRANPNGRGRRKVPTEAEISETDHELPCQVSSPRHLEAGTSHRACD